jgi:hypothetical protein
MRGRFGTEAGRDRGDHCGRAIRPTATSAAEIRNVR